MPYAGSSRENAGSCFVRVKPGAQAAKQLPVVVFVPYNQDIAGTKGLFFNVHRA